MGLQEKRHIQELQTNVIPGFEAGFEETVGAKIKLDVNWQSFSDDLEALQNLEHQGLDRIQRVLRSICVDDLGKAAIKKKLDTHRMAEANKAFAHFAW